MRPVLPALLLAVALAACSPDEPETPPSASGACQETPGIAYRTDGRLTFLRPDGAEVRTIAIEVADTDSTIQRGLMQRKCLPADWGMLFVFPNAQPRTFYMANTPTSLDILFFGPDSTLLNAAKYTRPFDPATLPSDGPARWVVETPAGFADTYGLQPGDKIRWALGGAEAEPPADTDSVDAAAAE